MPLLEREEITTIQSVFLLGKQYIAIGTAIFATEEEYDESTFTGSAAVIHAREGRVLLVEPRMGVVDGVDGEEWKVEVVCVEKTVGPVHALAVLHGFLVIAAASKVSPSLTFHDRVGEQVVGGLGGRCPADERVQD